MSDVLPIEAARVERGIRRRLRAAALGGNTEAARALDGDWREVALLATELQEFDDTLAELRRATAGLERANARARSLSADCRRSQVERGL